MFPTMPNNLSPPKTKPPRYLEPPLLNHLCAFDERLRRHLGRINPLGTGSPYDEKQYILTTSTK